MQVCCFNIGNKKAGRDEMERDVGERVWMLFGREYAFYVSRLSSLQVGYLFIFPGWFNYQDVRRSFITDPTNNSDGSHTFQAMDRLLFFILKPYTLYSTPLRSTQRRRPTTYELLCLPSLLPTLLKAVRIWPLRSHVGIMRMLLHEIGGLRFPAFSRIGDPFVCQTGLFPGEYLGNQAIILIPNPLILQENQPPIEL